MSKALFALCLFVLALKTKESIQTIQTLIDATNIEDKAFHTLKADSGYLRNVEIHNRPYQEYSFKGVVIQSSDPQNPEIVLKAIFLNGSLILSGPDGALKLCSGAYCYWGGGVTNYVSTTGFLEMQKSPDYKRPPFQPEVDEFYGVENFWKAERLSNGKWVFQGANKKYLGRCTQEVTNLNYACALFEKKDPEAQWTVNKVSE